MSTPSFVGAVVVDIDTSGASQRALHAAVDAAHQAQCPLVIVHATEVGLRAYGNHLLARAAASARRQHPEVDVTVVALTGDIADTLDQAALTAVRLFSGGPWRAAAMPPLLCVADDGAGLPDHRAESGPSTGRPMTVTGRYNQIRVRP